MSDMARPSLLERAGDGEAPAAVARRGAGAAEDAFEADEEIVVVARPVGPRPDRRTVLGAFAVMWRELTAGVGVWGSLRPLGVTAAAFLPFIYAGQHLNRQHRKAFDWTALQVPLALTVILWPPLYLYSIWDAWTEANRSVARRATAQRRDAVATELGGAAAVASLD